MVKQRGATLIELLVVMGILIILVASSSTFFVNMQREQNSISVKQDLSALVFELQNIISTNATCRNGFGNTRCLT